MTLWCDYLLMDGLNGMDEAKMPFVRSPDLNDTTGSTSSESYEKVDDVNIIMKSLGPIEFSERKLSFTVILHDDCGTRKHAQFSTHLKVFCDNYQKPSDEILTDIKAAIRTTTLKFENITIADSDMLKDRIDKESFNLKWVKYKENKPRGLIKIHEEAMITTKHLKHHLLELISFHEENQGSVYLHDDIQVIVTFQHPVTFINNQKMNNTKKPVLSEVDFSQLYLETDDHASTTAESHDMSQANINNEFNANQEQDGMNANFLPDNRGHASIHNNTSLLTAHPSNESEGAASTAASSRRRLSKASMESRRLSALENQINSVLPPCSVVVGSKIPACLLRNLTQQFQFFCSTTCPRKSIPTEEMKKLVYEPFMKKQFPTLPLENMPDLEFFKVYLDDHADVFNYRYKKLTGDNQNTAVQKDIENRKPFNDVRTLEEFNTYVEFRKAEAESIPTTINIVDRQCYLSMLYGIANVLLESDQTHDKATFIKYVSLLEKQWHSLMTPPISKIKKNPLSKKRKVDNHPHDQPKDRNNNNGTGGGSNLGGHGGGSGSNNTSGDERNDQSGDNNKSGEENDPGTGGGGSVSQNATHLRHEANKHGQGMDARSDVDMNESDSCNSESDDECGSCSEVDSFADDSDDHDDDDDDDDDDDTHENHYIGNNNEQNVSCSSTFDYLSSSSAMINKIPNVMLIERLFIAVHTNDINYLRLCLADGVNLEESLKNGFTAFDTAVMLGYLEIVQCLWESMDDESKMEKAVKSALVFATCRGHVKVLKYLIRNCNANCHEKFTNGRTVLHFASDIGKLSTLKCLVKYGDIDIYARDDYGLTSLHIATENGDLRTAHFLIVECGASMKVCDNKGFTPLHYASQWGHLQIVKLMVKRGADVNMFCYRPTPLHVACQRNHLEVIQWLLQEGMANVEAVDQRGYKVLHFACQENNFEVVQYLLQDGKTDVKVVDHQGCTPLHIACQSGHLEMVKYLIHQWKADVTATDHSTNTSLHLACQKNSFEIVQYLLKEGGANVEARNTYGNTPLHLACRADHLEMVQYLIHQWRADTTAIDHSRNTLLHLACQANSFKVVHYLLQEGKAKIEATNKDGCTPLDLACKNNHVKMVHYLTQHWKADANHLLHLAYESKHLELVHYLLREGKANVDATDKNGCTVLHLAFQRNNSELVQYLLKEGRANVNATDENGYTVLHLACQQKELEMVKYLVEEGKADVNAADHRRYTPLHLSCQLNQLEIVQFLLQEGKANVEAVDHRGYTPLYLACQAGHLKVVQYLIQQWNADATVTDLRGYTALHVACRMDRFIIVQYLLQEGKVNVDATDNNGYTSLHLSCQENRLDLIKCLLQEGNANVEVADRLGNTALHIACNVDQLRTEQSQADLVIIQYLVQHGNANVKAANHYGETALSIARRLNHKLMVQYLLQVGQVKHNAATNASVTSKAKDNATTNTSVTSKAKLNATTNTSVTSKSSRAPGKFKSLFKK